jgi:predicted nuclease of restriction endonuclease-like (RecB) superfamily
MPKTPALFSEDENYFALLDGLKKRIRSAQIKAEIAVNQELILLYWQIGQEILAQQQKKGWGSKVIERLAKDLKREFPDMKEFSTRNLKYMRAFAEAWPDEPIVQQLVAQIPWGHNVRLLELVKDSKERLRNLNTPIAVSTHRLPKALQEQLPSIEQLEMELEAAISEIEAEEKDSPD